MSEWKRIRVPVDYEVSDKGEVRKYHSHLPIHGDPNKDGYLMIRFRVKGMSFKIPLHRVVAMTYVPGYEEDLTVNHKDGNKLNNAAENLEWVTRDQNNKHAQETGLLKKRKVKKHLTERKVRNILRDAGTTPRRALARKYKVSIKTIKNILKGKTWKDVPRGGTQENN